DVTLMTVPGYPVAGTHTAYYGGEVYNLPLREENGFYPDLASIPADIRRRAKLLVINYPNSPTGATATQDFYRRVIDFAHTNQIVVVQDAAHILLSYDGPPLSFLQVDGAKEVGVEIHSLSKGFNMIGWRMASSAATRSSCRPSPTSRTTATPGSSWRSSRPPPWRCGTPRSPTACARST